MSIVAGCGHRVELGDPLDSAPVRCFDCWRAADLLRRAAAARAALDVAPPQVAGVEPLVDAALDVREQLDERFARARERAWEIETGRRSWDGLTLATINRAAARRSAWVGQCGGCRRALTATNESCACGFENDVRGRRNEGHYR